MATESKKIVLNYDDGNGSKEYTLMFNKFSVRRMQENGFDVSKYDTAPNVVIPDLFAGAFIAKHPMIKPSVVNAIYEDCPNKQGLIEALLGMYTEPVEGLFDEPERKNVEWTVV